MINPNQSSPFNASEIYLSLDLVGKFEEVVLAEILLMCSLKEKFWSMTMDLSCLEGDDYKTKYYTGIQYFRLLKSHEAF